jgi:hypothetical protein
MHKYLSKMTLRQTGLWVMVMLDPAYRNLYNNRSNFPAEEAYLVNVSFLLEQSSITFKGLLNADTAQLQENIVSVENAAYNVASAPNKLGWIGETINAAMLGLEMLLQTLVIDRAPTTQKSRLPLNASKFIRAISQIEVSRELIIPSLRDNAYHLRLDTIGNSLIDLDTLDPDDPFGQPLPRDFVKESLKATYFGENW